jgi:hypothetical protein
MAPSAVPNQNLKQKHSLGIDIHFWVKNALYCHPDVNFINMFTLGFFMQKTKKQLVFENEFHQAFLYDNCAGCAMHKSHLAVLVVLAAIRN